MSKDNENKNETEGQNNKLTGLISLLPIEHQIDDIAPEWDEEKKLKAVYPHLLNAHIKVFNNKLEIKNKKAELKDLNIEAPEFFQANLEIIQEKENKKLSSGETIEVYKDRLNEGDEFDGVQLEVSELIHDKLEIADDKKNILKNSSSTLGLDKKALGELAKNKVKELDPNYKPKETDIVLDGMLEKYSNILSKNKDEEN